MMIEDETRVSQEACAHAMGYSAAVHYELQAYRAHTQIQNFRISSQKALTTTLVAQAGRPIQRNANLNDDGSQGSGSGIIRPVRPTRECTYSDFLKCQPLNFKVENQVKFATCTLHGIALTWWNTYVKTVGHDAAYGMPWKTLMKMMTTKYCPRNKIKKLEIKIWNLKVNGTDLASYT
ncbi:reverse transcriptase domain-containing protein [Tanacetum coccineum]